LTYVRGRCEIANTWNFGPDGESERRLAAPVFAGRQLLAYDGAMVTLTRHKGYVHHASPDEPQYEIKSDKTDHIALHKGRALRRLSR